MYIYLQNESNWFKLFDQILRLNDDNDEDDEDDEDEAQGKRRAK